MKKKSTDRLIVKRITIFFKTNLTNISKQKIIDIHVCVNDSSKHCNCKQQLINLRSEESFFEYNDMINYGRSYQIQYIAQRAL